MHVSITGLSRSVATVSNILKKFFDFLSSGDYYYNASDNFLMANLCLNSYQKDY